MSPPLRLAPQSSPFPGGRGVGVGPLPLIPLEEGQGECNTSHPILSILSIHVNTSPQPGGG